jgi:NAD(P)-dependent dehydrogenase (short-subunit alcohol dehydrogenase family)
VKLANRIAVVTGGGSARGKMSLFCDSEADTWDSVLGTNLMGVFYTYRAVFGRFGEPTDIANRVAFLASDEATFITGQNYPVCGVMNLGFADSILG